jgi:hypothetical protein
MTTLILGEDVPAVYWDSLPLEQLEAWVRANMPAEAADTLERGMQTARFKLSQKQALNREADAFIVARRGS